MYVYTYIYIYIGSTPSRTAYGMRARGMRAHCAASTAGFEVLRNGD